MGVSTTGITAICIIIGVFVFVGGALIISHFRSGNMKQEMVKLFKEKYPDVTYIPDNGISREDYLNMHLLKIGSTFEASDNIAGKAADGTEFNYCEVNTYSIKMTHRNLNPLDVSPKRETEFKGAILVFKREKIIDGQIVIKSRGLLEGKGFDKSNVNEHDFDDDGNIIKEWHTLETDSVNFNKSFQLYTKNDEEAFYILRPDIMEALVELDKRYTWGMDVCFIGDLLYLAIPELDLLEPDGLTINNNKSKKEETALIDQAMNEINYIIRILKK